MSVLLQCLSHTPLVGHFDPAPPVLAEVDSVVAAARERIKAFQPELAVLFAPDHYNGFFYDVMPSFCIGMAAHAIGDFGTAAGPLQVPQELAEECAAAVLDAGVDTAVSYRMQLDHGAAQPLELLLGGLRKVPVIPVFINSVAIPLPSFQRARLLGEAIGRWARALDKRVLLVGSGGLSHQPPVPELAKVEGLMADRLKGSGRHLPADEREARTQRVILAAKNFVQDPNSLHPLNPEWDRRFLSLLEQGQLSELDGMGNAELSALAGKSTHEIKAWVAAFAALSSFGPYQTSDRYYREIPEWIAGFGALSARPEAVQA
ncbi:TPA: 3-carboxyethylcatechol 2,3-dioxygenase [Pseudomonas aeruginosa]|uniref:2,3-dihydroxyphenylpropionate/2,3-dihydroxicinnamic acid 1,2-dioxygenase n=1 Tax=Pseudomonas putida TaxID=303 RepID=A0A1L7N6R1_PSEPU|nr:MULTISPECIES: 3-carboxyethylcatechol 2,3-dioxygenase [Pseudomonas]KFJ90075.1 3-(2,3-dihydroxyphenyl)propionate dioxygenase [Pseudomonas sp. 1-7]MBA5010990.1 3-carboxyethylcatechol 2,3-dioxygenase [Pseudomonas aeruginosa]RQD53915.1 3-(2,3-dihydroxyphenyl)propionate dioxygenase [Pseudomonas aeruginosa]BAW21145.1 2,3-dihydroxyphenylpropionate/2,3-dihydroxicinnamic acid 1,2- dioxygenase [Pseudomonas putida]HBN9599248.1 3-carboxyethylcatechol 2,3-dioxygenase [Pseudomonas aeruginosa]